MRGIDGKTKHQGKGQKPRLLAPVLDQGQVRTHQNKPKNRARPGPSLGSSQDTGKPSRLKEQEIDKLRGPKGLAHRRPSPSGSPMRESRNW